jgi:putative transposase
MSSSWTQNYYHIVYGTKLRTPWIAPEIETRIHAFVGGIAKDLKCTPIAINGMAEHIHVLVRFPSDLALSVLVRDLKSRSTNWIRPTFPGLGDFSWQEGYGGFTVSKPNVEAVAEYIRDQKIRHRARTFEEEYLQMFRESGWEGNPEDLFG